MLMFNYLNHHVSTTYFDTFINKIAIIGVSEILP